MVTIQLIQYSMLYPSRQSRRINVHEVLKQRFIEYKDFEDQVLTIPMEQN